MGSWSDFLSYYCPISCPFFCTISCPIFCPISCQILWPIFLCKILGANEVSIMGDVQRGQLYKAWRQTCCQLSALPDLDDTKSRQEDMTNRQNDRTSRQDDIENRHRLIFDPDYNSTAPGLPSLLQNRAIIFISKPNSTWLVKINVYIINENDSLKLQHHLARVYLPYPNETRKQSNKVTG